MAHSTIIFTHPAFGSIKRAPVGFSWTVFFFGFFPPLIRGDWKWAVIYFIAIVAISAVTMGVGGWILGIIFAFLYNKLYVKELVERGFKVTGLESQKTKQQLSAELEIVLPEPQAA